MCVCVCCLKCAFVLKEIISISLKVNIKWDSQLILLPLLDVFQSEYVGLDFIHGDRLDCKKKKGRVKFNFILNIKLSRDIILNIKVLQRCRFFVGKKKKPKKLKTSCHFSSSGSIVLKSMGFLVKCLKLGP